MNKILLFWAAIFVLSISSCKDKEDDIIYLPITGTWKPIKMVETIVNTTSGVSSGNSETYYYTTCQQESRWIFNSGGKGSTIQRDDTFVPCYTKFQSNFNYTYDEKSGNINIKYIAFEENGKITDLTDKTMNLKIESIDPISQKYTSKVYSLVKVQ